MLYVLHAIDKPNSPLRQQLVEAHRTYMDNGPVRVVASGPLTDDAGTKMIGSIIIFSCDDRAEIDALMVNEPFYKAGLFETLHISRWEQRVGMPIASGGGE